MTSKHTIRAADLSLGAMVDFEKLAGVSFMKAFESKRLKDEHGNFILDEDGQPVEDVDISAETMLHLVYIAMRDEDPSYTLEQARKLKLSEIELDLRDEEEEEGEDPTPASDPSTKSSLA